MDNIHITLIPPWREKDIEKVKQLLRLSIKNYHPFKAEFNRISFGPNAKKPRLIWIEGKESKAMLSLKENLEKVLKKKKEKRDFKPHITIARFKEKDYFGFRIKEINGKVSWIENIEAIYLYESKTLPSGAEYKILGKIKLGE